MHEIRIPTWALPYIVNGDPSGLTQEETSKVDNFARRVREDFGIQDLSLGSGLYDEPYFSWWNDIDGHLGANVVDVVYL